LIDGRDVYRAARAMGYRGPVIVCSAFGARDAQRELGAEAAISKPFDPADPPVPFATSSKQPPAATPRKRRTRFKLRSVNSSS